MDVPGWVWGLTIVGIVGLLAFDFVFHVRKAHVPTLKEAAVWSAAYVGIAVLFGVGVFVSAASLRVRSTSPATSLRRRCRSITCSSS